MNLLKQTKTFLKQNTLFNPNGASNKTDFCNIHLKTFYNLIFFKINISNMMKMIHAAYPINDQ